jgi:hypothetical protein
MILFSATPEPAIEPAFCKGVLAKMSPKSADDRLNPAVPALAILFEVTLSSVVAAFNPVSDV